MLSNCSIPFIEPCSSIKNHFFDENPKNIIPEGQRRLKLLTKVQLLQKLGLHNIYVFSRWIVGNNRN